MLPRWHGRDSKKTPVTGATSVFASREYQERLCPEQLRHRIRRAIDDADRTAVGGDVLLVVIDAQRAANRGHEVEGADRAFDDGGGFGIGAADDLAAADAGARHHAAPRTRIVVAARLGPASVDARRTA